MASVEPLSGRHFWRYQKEVFKRAGRRWWKTRGKHWWAEATGAGMSAVVRSLLETDPEWWHSAAAAIGGGAGVALLVYLYQLVITSTLIDAEKTARIQRLSGQLTADDVAQSHKQRVDLYKRILKLVSKWGDLATLVDSKPASEFTREHAAELRSEVSDVSELVSFSDAWWREKYAREIDTIRRRLLVQSEPKPAVDHLREPMRRLEQIAEIDRQWDLSRQPSDHEGREP